MNRVHQRDYRVVIDLLETFDCPRSLTVAILFRYSEFAQIVNLSFDPLSYNGLEAARWSLYATELLRKHEDLPTGISRDQIAYEGFFAAEKQCQDTNDRLNSDRIRCAPYLHRMAKNISTVLGDFDAEEFVDSAGWGPGATLSIKRRDATPSNKFRQKAELTQPLFAFVKPWFGTAFPKWPLIPCIAHANKVITVPKNAKTDRIIAIEPSLNLFFQKGVGQMIRRRLKRFAVDLNQQSINQEAARVGSLTDSLATIDFSAASDTISYTLIKDTLPFRWYDILDRLRSERGNVLGETIEYEKFSSMGNGFTFELESLIFWSAALAVVPDDHPLRSSCNSYGDDVIIPSDCVGEFSSFCDFIGFTVNKRKSYASSYYRESCGKHYWNGHDITPIYLRRFLVKDEIMRFHNRVVELSRRTIAEGFRDKRFSSVINLLADMSPIKARIPIGYGDLGLVSDFDLAVPRFCRKLHRGWYAKAYIPVPTEIQEDDESFFLSKLFALGKQSDVIGLTSPPKGNFVSLPSRPRYKVKTLYFEEWPPLGIWI